VGPGQRNTRAPLIITVRDHKGTVVATRRIPEMLLEKRTYRSLLLYDVGCAGVLSLTAQLGGSRRTEKINLACGE